MLELRAQDKTDAKYLASELSIDHSDPQIRQLYHAYFNENGLYKGYENHPLLQDVHIPYEMGTEQNIQAKANLHSLLDQKTCDEKTKQQIIKITSNTSNIERISFDQQADELCPAYGQRHEQRNQVNDTKQEQEPLVLADKTISFLKVFNIDTGKYEMKHEKPIVQQAANEAIEIFNQTVELQEKQVLPLEFLDLTITVADKGFDKVLNGNINEGFELIEVGHACCEYGWAIAKGIGLGLWDTGRGMIVDHPLETALLIMTPQYYFAYQLGKLTLSLAVTGITYAFNAEKGKKQWTDNYIAPIKNIISALSDQESKLTGPEKATLIARTGIAAQWYLTKKARQAYQKLLTGPRFDLLKQDIVKQIEKKVSGNITKTMQAGKAFSEQAAQLIWKKSKDLKILQERIKQLIPKMKKTKIGSFLDKISSAEEMLECDKKAEILYHTIRKSIDDVNKISKNLNLPQKIILQIKKHIFFEDHILNNGIGKFPADLDMARAWQRLVNGNFVKSDLRLLLHEFSESLIMNGKEVSWSIAHPLANKFSNWEQNL